MTQFIHSLPLLNLHHCTRDDVLHYFNNTWSLTEILFSALKEEKAFYEPPYHQLRHPLIFYYCHPAALYINKLRIAGLINHPVDAYFEQLFETGVDEMAWDDLAKNHLSWPKINAVITYRKTVYQTIQHLIKTHPTLDQGPITPTHPFWALLMGLEHERIHLETSSVLIRELPIHFVQRPKQWPNHYDLSMEKHPVNNWLEMAATEISLGKPADWPSYGWDNEYGKKIIKVNNFRATQYLISNGEFLEFVIDGGYHDPGYWSSDGWQWRAFRNTKWPTFWVPDGPAGLHQYQLRLCFEIVPMQLSWPAEVNYHEAKAYCAWRSKKDKSKRSYRLLTEAEHHVLRDQTSDDPIMRKEQEEQKKQKINVNLTFGSPTPVHAMAPTQQGFYDVFGNVWERCEDHFSALPGFEINHLYDDFSTPCFDGKHRMIMGGSFISTGAKASKFARFHFRPHFFQHTGFRLVQSLGLDDYLETSCLDAPPPHVGAHPCCSKEKNSSQENVYETQQLLNQYLLLHYGNHEQTLNYPLLPQNVIAFPKRCAELLCDMAAKNNLLMRRVLDLGCAVGGASFELARQFSNVLGIDLSQSFIATANKIKHEGKISFSRKEEGELLTALEVQLDSAIDRSRVKFQVRDACALPADLGTFDAILLANLLCRLTYPTSCLARMGGPLGLVKPGGLLMITSPYSWLPAYTPSEAWLGGNKNNLSINGLQNILNPEFELIYEINMPLIIREHGRKFEYIITHATIWRRILCT